MAQKLLKRSEQVEIIKIRDLNFERSRIDEIRPKNKTMERLVMMKKGKVMLLKAIERSRFDRVFDFGEIKWMKKAI